MKQSKRIFLITNIFPFSFKEQFLETEIKYWNEITIIPINDGVKARETYGNIVSSEVAISIGRLRKFDFKAAVATVSCADLYKEFWRKPKILLSLSMLLNLIRFIYLGIRFEKALLTNLDFTEDSLFYSYWLSWASYGLTRVKRKHNNIQIVARAHRGDLYSYSQPKNYMPLNKNYVANIDCIYSISDDGKKHLVEQYGIPEAKIKVSRLGVKAQELNLVEKSKSVECVNILSVSYVKPVKRVDLIAKMISEYSKQNPEKEVTWTHLGGGDTLGQLLKLAKTLHFKINLPGMVDNHEVYKFYKNKNVDLFINLSTSEGIPVSIMEAISFGVPVVATNVGGSKEIVCDEVGALLNVNFSVDDFVDSVDYALNLDRIKIIKFFDDNYNAEVNYTKFVEQIENY